MSDPQGRIRGKARELSREALDGLLDRLAPDREEAGLLYVVLRSRLTDIFIWEGEPDPEHLADETLNRLAHRLREGEPIRDLHHYAVGIARLVILEAARSRERQISALSEIKLSPPSNPAPAEMESMERCLKALPAESRELIERYYSGGRARLAESLGISINTLRNRALRIRQRLYDCMRHKRDDRADSAHHE